MLASVSTPLSSRVVIGCVLLLGAPSAPYAMLSVAVPRRGSQSGEQEDVAGGDLEVPLAWFTGWQFVSLHTGRLPLCMDRSAMINTFLFFPGRACSEALRSLQMLVDDLGAVEQSNYRVMLKVSVGVLTNFSQHCFLASLLVSGMPQKMTGHSCPVLLVAELRTTYANCRRMESQSSSIVVAVQATSGLHHESRIVIFGRGNWRAVVLKV